MVVKVDRWSLQGLCNLLRETEGGVGRERGQVREAGRQARRRCEAAVGWRRVFASEVQTLRLKPLPNMV
jgi:hypothetical protein